MTSIDFFKKWDGRYIDFDGFYGFQCVDLMRQFIKEVFRLSPYSAIPQTGTARNIFNSFSDNVYFQKVKNAPTNMPKQGDLVFWGFFPLVTGWAGHVAICSEANVRNMITFDQNYPTGSHCRYVRHDYRGVLGWLTRK